MTFKQIFTKKSMKRNKMLRKSQFDDKRTRNPEGGMFTTNETAPYHLNNESHIKIKTTDRAKIRRTKKRTSTSNSHSKSKCAKSITEYTSKFKDKSSSRTSSTFK